MEAVTDSSATIHQCHFQRTVLLALALKNSKQSRLDPKHDEGGMPCKGPFLHLVIHLWPGNWRDQLRNLNLCLEQENQQTTRHKAKQKKTLVSGEHAIKNIVGCVSLLLFPKLRVALTSQKMNGGKSGASLLQHVPSTKEEMNCSKVPHHHSPFASHQCWT